jgi:hypothetical protein
MNQEQLFSIKIDNINIETISDVLTNKNIRLPTSLLQPIYIWNLH